MPNTDHVVSMLSAKDVRDEWWESMSFKECVVLMQPTWDATMMACVVTWNNCYPELEVYKKEKGAILAPQQYPENKALGMWVISLAKRVEEEEGWQTELVDRQEGNGIEWVGLCLGCCWDVLEWSLSWSSSVQEGGGWHPSSPTISREKNIGMGVWVMNQCKEWKKKKDDKHSLLTNEREQTLNELGFAWDVCW